MHVRTQGRSVNLEQLLIDCISPPLSCGSSSSSGFAFLIEHSQEQIWSLQLTLRFFCSLGTLALLFGDGEIQLLSIPKPQSQPGTSDSSERDAGNGASDHRSMCNPITIQPDVLLSKEDVPRLGSCMDWLSCPPYDLILVSFTSVHMHRYR